MLCFNGLRPGAGNASNVKRELWSGRWCAKRGGGRKLMEKRVPDKFEDAGIVGITDSK